MLAGYDGGEFAGRTGGGADRARRACARALCRRDARPRLSCSGAPPEQKDGHGSTNCGARRRPRHCRARRGPKARQRRRTCGRRPCLVPADPTTLDRCQSDYVSSGRRADLRTPALRPSAGGEKRRASPRRSTSARRLAFAGSPDMKCRRSTASLSRRRRSVFRAKNVSSMAARLLDAWGVTGLDARDVVTMGDRFLAFVAKQWPEGILRREAPITHRLGDQTLSGRIDAVIETGRDHRHRS